MTAPKTREELHELVKLIEAMGPPLEPEEGDYAEECPEYPGVVFIRRANGTPLLMMSLSVWLELRKDAVAPEGVSDEAIRAAVNDKRCQTSDGKHTFDPKVFGGSCTACGMHPTELL